MLACDSTWVTSFLKHAFEYPLNWHAYSVSVQVLCIPYNHAPCHFMQSHIRKVYACLAATYHLHFWQNDRDLLHATAVTRGWNGYRNKSHYRQFTLEKKILPPLLQGFEPATFQSWVWHSNHWALSLLPVKISLPTVRQLCGLGNAKEWVQREHQSQASQTSFNWTVHQNAEEKDHLLGHHFL